MGKVIGIDLGTTNSCVTVLEGDTYKVIENQEGDRTTPSIVAKTEDDEWIVGDTAKRQAVTNAKNTLYAIKRLIGRRFDDEKTKELQDKVPYKIVKADNGDAWVEVDGVAMSPSEVSAKTLQKLKQAAEDYLGEEVTDAVITVPAYFDDSQRQATKDSGTIAGLNVLRVVNEPTAAALAYGLDKSGDSKVIVYDLGGGTFDVSVLELEDDDGEKTFSVLSTNGDTFLGGEDFDNRIIDFLADKFQEENNIDLRKDELALQRLKEAAENAKKELSSSMQAKVNIPYITVDASGPKHLDVKMSRNDLETVVADLIERTIGPCKQAMEDAGVDASEIDEVILVGGMTRMPKVREVVEKHFGKAPNKSVNPDEVVAAGAAFQAGIISGDIDNALLVDVTPLNIGVKLADGAMDVLVEANSPMPCKGASKYTTHRDNQPDVQVELFQGNRAKATDNKKLGEFILEVSPGKAGEVEVALVAAIDANGILNVTGIDTKTGKEAEITIKANGGLTEDQIEQMQKDAEANEAEDKAFKDEVEVKHQMEGALEAVKKAQDKDYYKGADDDMRQAFNDAGEKLQTAQASGNVSEMKEAIDAFVNTSKDMIDAYNKKQAPEQTEQSADAATANSNAQNATNKPNANANRP